MGIEVGIKSEHSKDCKFYVAVGHGQRGNSRLLTCACAKVVFWTEGKDERGKTKMGRKQFRTLADAEAFQAAKQAELNGNNDSLPAAVRLPGMQAVVGGTPTSKVKTVRQAIVDFLDFKRHDFNQLTREKISEGHVESRLTPLLVNFLKYVNRKFAGVNETSLDLKELRECNVPLAAIEPEHIIEFRNQLKKEDGSEYAQSTLGKLIDNLGGFFNTCIELRYGIAVSPVTKKTHVPAPDHQEPKALTDDQVAQLFAAIPKLQHRDGDDVISTLPSVLLLQRWAGLSIADAVTLEREKLLQNGGGFWKVETARAKTNKPVYCTLTAEVAQQVLAGARPTGKYLFVESVPKTEKQRKALVARWGRRISQLGLLAGITDEHGEQLDTTSHWLRHTFVRWCFDNDISTEDVAELIGDSVATVAKHYSGWIHARQERLTEKMKAALAPRVKPATAGN